jgi:TfoX/Sxy family transcriptional regulator of competence genes
MSRREVRRRSSFDTTRRGTVDWEKPSPELIRILEEASEPFAVIERRKMFGCPAYYVNGNMTAGVYGTQLFLRLPPEAREELRSSHDAKSFEPMAGRPMKEYVQLPEAIWADAAALDEWLRRSVEFASSLPPKQPKPRKTSKTEPKGS